MRQVAVIGWSCDAHSTNRHRLWPYWLLTDTIAPRSLSQSGCHLLISGHRSPFRLPIVSNRYILLWQRCRRMGMILQILLHLEKHGNDSVAWYKSQLPPPNPSLHHPGLVSQKCCTLPPCHLMVYTSQLSPVSPLDVCALFNRPFLSCVLTEYIKIRNIRHLVWALGRVAFLCQKQLR